MCLTGGFTLTLMLEPSVIAPVLSQPSLPFPILGHYSPRCLKSSLGTDPDSLAKAAERHIDVLGLRFSEDWRCPPERFDSLRALFGAHFVEHSLASGDKTCFPTKAHSVLTYSDHGAPSKEADERARLLRDAYDSLTAFLRQRLR
jgi:dienelactone hydrolase